MCGVCNPPKVKYVDGRRSITWPIYFAIRLLPVLLQERFDIIDCQNFPFFPCYSAKITSKIKKSTLVITWHEVWADYWFEYLGKAGVFGKTIEKLTTHLASRNIAVSRQTLEALVAVGLKKQIQIIPNGIDLSLIESVKPSSELSDIVFAGRLIKEKHVELLINLINLLKKENPSIKAVIIGDGPEKEDIEKLIDNLKLRDNVLLLGRMETDTDVYSYLKSSKVFLSLSSREGFGIIALEANACGLPVVTVKHPQNAICDLIVEGANGFTCESSLQDLAHKVLMVRSESDNLSHNCVEYAKGHDWDKIAGDLEIFYAVSSFNK